MNTNNKIPVRENDEGWDEFNNKTEFVEIKKETEFKNRFDKYDDTETDSELKTEIRIPKIFRNFTILLVLLSLFSFAGIIVLSQFVSVYKDIIGLPFYLKYLSFSILGFFIIIILITIFKIITFYFRLKLKPVIRLKNIETLNELNHIDLQNLKKYKGKLIKYLKNYNIKNNFKKLKLHKVYKTEMNCLIESQKKLLDHNYRVETKIWLLKYKTDFQDIIEIILKKQIKKYSVLTALKTGIIPFPIMDTIIVFYYNLKIFKISSMMFNIKLNFIESVYLLTRIFINTAIAGELQKGTEKITTNTIDYLKESDFADVTTKFFGPLNAIAPKIAESAANFLFTYRLGLKTLKLFKPITETLK